MDQQILAQFLNKANNGDIDAIIKVGELYGDDVFSEENFHNAKTYLDKAIALNDPRGYRFIILLHLKYLHFYINSFDINKTTSTYKTGIEWCNKGIAKHIPGEFSTWQKKLTDVFNDGIKMQANTTAIPVFETKKKKTIIKLCIFSVIIVIFFISTLFLNTPYLIVVASICLAAILTIAIFLIFYFKRHKKNIERLNQVVKKVENSLDLPSSPTVPKPTNNHE